MHPRLTELFAQLDSERAALRATLDAIPVPLRDRRPAPDRWSVRDVMEHLVIVERRVAETITAAIAQAVAAGLPTDDGDPSVATTVDRARLRDRTRRLEAPARIHPQGSDDVEGLWVGLQAAREALKAGALAGDGLTLAAVTAPHPFFGVLNAYQWLDFVAGHEARHAAQMREVAAQLGGQPAGTTA